MNFDKEYEQISSKRKENYDRRNTEFLQIKEYYNKCNNYLKVAKKFGVCWRTVKAYAHMDRLPINKRKSISKLNKFKEIIIDNIDKKQADIYLILKKKGYKGTFSSLRMYIYKNNLKVSTIDKNKYVNRTNIIEILHHKSISDLMLNNEDTKILKQLLKQDKVLSRLLELNDNFSITLFSNNPDKLDK